MPQVSVFTPSHDSRWLNECFASLKAQTVADWEWILLLQETAWQPPEPDGRVRILEAPRSAWGRVGALKAAAVRQTTGEIVVELDHDDVLLPTCLAQVLKAFDDPGVVFAYSDWADMDEDGHPSTDRFDAAYGWEYSPIHLRGAIYTQVHAMAPTPHNLGYVWYAPNHVRAFRRSAYDTVGGYDDLEILDDHDLMVRLYARGEFVHIPEVLYLQRVHAGSTQRRPETNATIQAGTVQLYDRYIESMAMAWAERNGLAALDLGSLHGKPGRYLGVDRSQGPDVDFVLDLGSEPLPFANSTVGVIRAVDFLEHVVDKVALMNELHRVLAPSGLLLSSTPSTDGRGAFQDPTHVSYWNSNSFWYWTDPFYAGYVPEITARFQVSRLVDYFPSPWHEERRISYVGANLIAPKDGPRQGGLLHW
jgi:glycosyltransferase involved in cell wall biosynthesis